MLNANKNNTEVILLRRFALVIQNHITYFSWTSFSWNCSTFLTSLLLLLFSFCRSFYLLRSQRQVFVKLNTFLEHRYFQNLLSTHKKIWPRHSSDDASSVCARHKFYVRRLGSTDCIASTALKIIKSWIFK